MKASRQITVLCSLVLLACLAGTIIVLRPLDRMSARSSDEDVLYVPSAKVLKRLSFGYNGLAADIYWTRAVQYFGERHQQRARQYPMLAPLLEITTSLDSKLLVAYQFGSMFLSQKPPEGAGLPDKAVELVEKGIRENPDKWQLYYNLGFIHLVERRDYAAAQNAFERGSKVPNANPALKVLAASMAQQAGNIDTARLLWTKIYETSEDKSVRANAMKRLMALDVDQSVLKLEDLLRRFQGVTGRQPTNFAEMVAAGWLRRVPIDPTGTPYKLRPDGHVEVESESLHPFIHYGLPLGKKPFDPTMPIQ